MKRSLLALAGVALVLNGWAFAGQTSVTNIVTQGSGTASVDSVDVRADGVYVDGTKVADLRPDGTAGDIRVVNGDVYVDGRKVKAAKDRPKDVQTGVNVGGVSAPAGTKVTKRVSVGSVTNVQAPEGAAAAGSKGVVVDRKTGEVKAGSVEVKGGTVKAGSVTVGKDAVVVEPGGGEGVVKMKKTVIGGVEVEMPE
jgi:hypothetical protein